MYRGSARHTRLGHHFQGQKVKGQGHQAALLTALLVRQAAAAAGVATCWPWETAATLPSVRRRKALRRPRGGEGRGISWRPLAHSLLSTVDSLTLSRLTSVFRTTIGVCKILSRSVEIWQYTRAKNLFYEY